MRDRVSLAVFDAGGIPPLCHILSLAARVLADPPNRRPRGRQLRATKSEAEGLVEVISCVKLALMVLDYSLDAGRDQPAIAQDGVDPVARAVLDAGGHIAVVQFQAAAGRAPAAVRDRLGVLGENRAARVLELLDARPGARAAIAEAAAAAGGCMQD